MAAPKLKINDMKTFIKKKKIKTFGRTKEITWRLEHMHWGGLDSILSTTWSPKHHGKQPPNPPPRTHTSWEEALSMQGLAQKSNENPKLNTLHRSFETINFI